MHETVLGHDVYQKYVNEELRLQIYIQKLLRTRLMCMCMVRVCLLRHADSKSQDMYRIDIMYDSDHMILTYFLVILLIL